MFSTKPLCNTKQIINSSVVWETAFPPSSNRLFIRHIWKEKLSPKRKLLAKLLQSGHHTNKHDFYIRLHLTGVSRLELNDDSFKRLFFRKVSYFATNPIYFKPITYNAHKSQEAVSDLIQTNYSAQHYTLDRLFFLQHKSQETLPLLNIKEHRSELVEAPYWKLWQKIHWNKGVEHPVYKTSQKFGKSLNFTGSPRRFFYRLASYGSYMYEQINNAKLWYRPVKSKRVQKKIMKRNKKKKIKKIKTLSRIFKKKIILQKKSRKKNTQPPRHNPTLAEVYRQNLALQNATYFRFNVTLDSLQNCLRLSKQFHSAKKAYLYCRQQTKRWPNQGRMWFFTKHFCGVWKKPRRLSIKKQRQKRHKKHQKLIEKKILIKEERQKKKLQKRALRQQALFHAINKTIYSLGGLKLKHLALALPQAKKSIRIMLKGLKKPTTHVRILKKKQLKTHTPLLQKYIKTGAKKIWRQYKVLKHAQPESTKYLRAAKALDKFLAVDVSRKTAPILASKETVTWKAPIARRAWKLYPLPLPERHPQQNQLHTYLYNTTTLARTNAWVHHLSRTLHNVLTPSNPKSLIFKSSLRGKKWRPRPLPPHLYLFTNSTLCSTLNKYHLAKNNPGRFRKWKQKLLWYYRLTKTHQHLFLNIKHLLQGAKGHYKMVHKLMTRTFFYSHPHKQWQRLYQRLLHSDNRVGDGPQTSYDTLNSLTAHHSVNCFGARDHHSRFLEPTQEQPTIVDTIAKPLKAKGIKTLSNWVYNALTHQFTDVIQTYNEKKTKIYARSQRWKRVALARRHWYLFYVLAGKTFYKLKKTSIKKAVNAERFSFFEKNHAGPVTYDKKHVDFSYLFEDYISVTQPTLAFFPIKRRSYKKKKKIYLLKHVLKIAQAKNRLGKLYSIVKHNYFRWKRRRNRRNFKRGLIEFCIKELATFPHNKIQKHKSITHERIGRDAVNEIIFRRRLESARSR